MRRPAIDLSLSLTPWSQFSRLSGCVLALALRSLANELADVLGSNDAPLLPMVESAWPRLIALGTSTRVKPRR